ncbi:hypothetical protein [Gracilibacillus xinjiangensis]|uniref:Polymerase nucleotidyl transferase domain-containing protein n=1 Tax=Gracilibacillus xinjiangensis TaxID=1193282 RepID=A0ABV8WY04_9BACI
MEGKRILDLIGVYGSSIIGDYHEKSDLDLFNRCFLLVSDS